MIVIFKKAVTICLAVALLPCAAALGQQGQSGDDGVKSHPTTLPAESPLTPDRLFALASPAVVKLTIKDEDDREIGVASGFIVRFEKVKESDAQVRSELGVGPYSSTIITNYHVIRPAVSIDVSFTDGHSGTVLRVMAEDESADLAVLSASSFVEPKRLMLDFPPGTITMSLEDLRAGLSGKDNLRPEKYSKKAIAPIGTKVYAIGSPQGLSNTLSEGLISGYRQRGKHEPWIQITAPISSGSSGGPLLSPEGWVIGVTTAFFSEGQNLNFAVPVSEVSRLLRRTEKSRPIWQGASIRKTQEAADRDALFSFLPQAMEATIEEDGDIVQILERYREERLSAGDQLALLLKGRELYFDQLALVLKGRKQSFAEAISMFRRATKAEPGEYAYLAHLWLGLAIRDHVASVLLSTEIGDAIEPMKRAKELNPEFGPTFFWLSASYTTLRMFPEALVEAESVVRLMPRCYSGYRLRGRIWAELGREEAFERDFETALDLRPNDRDLIIAKGLGYVSLGNFQMAVDTYKDALKLDESYLLTLYYLGHALQKMGKYDEAIKMYQRGRKLGGVDDLGIEGLIAECRRMMQSP